MPSAILDAFGKPAVYIGGGGRALYPRTGDDNRLRPPPPNHFDDYASLLNPSLWKRLLSESRAIASRGQVAAALWQKADYVSGSNWQLYFSGEDADWGDEAEELLEETTTAVCTRGPRYDWRTIWHIGVPTCASDGGYFILLTTAQNDPTWPLLQPIEAHRIGQRDASSKVVAKSATTQIRNVEDPSLGPVTIWTPYTDLRIANGIIMNKQGMEIAYRVLGPTPEEDEDVSARDMIHIGAPKWFSELRPLPEIAPALLDLLGIDVARTSQLDQQILDSKITVLETNETGKRDQVRDMLNPPPIAPNPVSGSAPEMVERGQYRYLKKGVGELEAWQTNRPSDQWMNYDQRMSEVAIAAAGWRLEMLHPSELKGAATRGFQDQINTLIANAFNRFVPGVLRAGRYLISKHIQGGRLPDNKEFLKWAVQSPPEFVVDRASLRYEIEGVKAGFQSMPTLQRRNAMRPQKVLIEQAKYVAAKNAIAKIYKIRPNELGDLSMPGDALSMAGQDQGVDENGNPISGGADASAKMMADAAAAKSRLDAIGVAVRAGSLTPSPELEDEVRRLLSLPGMPATVRAAWSKDENIRLPITLKAGDAAPANQTRPINDNPHEE